MKIFAELSAVLTPQRCDDPKKPPSSKGSLPIGPDMAAVYRRHRHGVAIDCDGDLNYAMGRPVSSFGRTRDLRPVTREVTPCRSLCGGGH